MGKGRSGELGGLLDTTCEEIGQRWNTQFVHGGKVISALSLPSFGRPGLLDLKCQFPLILSVLSDF